MHIALHKDIYSYFLQCAMPPIEGLLPEPHNTVVLDVFWLLSSWHALAKLRLHTEGTRSALLTTTAALGRALRVFNSVTCAIYSQVSELPREAAARERRHARATETAIKQGLPIPQLRTETKGKRKMFSMNTFKLHHIAHYYADIAEFGTTDSYTTQTVSDLVIPVYLC